MAPSDSPSTTSRSSTTPIDLDALSLKHGQRSLIVIPESHLNRTEDVAIATAQRLAAAAPGLSITLFLEGRIADSGGTTDSLQGFTTVGVGSAACNDVYFPLAFITAAGQFARVAAVVGDPRNARTMEILHNATERSRVYADLHGKQGQEIDLHAIQHTILTELGYACASLQSRVAFDLNDFQDSLLEMPDTVSGQLPKKLKGFMVRALDFISEERRGRFNSISNEVTKELGVQLPTLGTKALTQLRAAILRADALRSYDLADSAFQSIRTVREFAMPLEIRKRSFDIGIYNCGLQHAASRPMQIIMGNAGINLVVNKTPMLERVRSSE